jgi:caffeoyl-CoA O-methyltransferase
LEQAGVIENIEVKIGDAKEIVKKISDTFDMIFQDVGDKKLYPLLFDDCVRILRPGGLLLAEDTLFPVLYEFTITEKNKTKFTDAEFIDKYNLWQEKFLVPINKFNETVANSPNLESTILSIGDGFTVAVKMIN